MKNTNKLNLNEVKLFSYGEYSSSNYGAHCMALKLGKRDLYFSYNTLVAFEGWNSKGEYFSCCRVNEWGTTTGKHLNWIQPNHKARLEAQEFEKQLNEFLK